MKEDVNECLQCIESNVEEINRFIAGYSTEDLNRLLADIEHVLKFYNVNKRDIEKLLNFGKDVLKNYSNKSLHELEGVTNAMLFKLKYKVEV